MYTLSRSQFDVLADEMLPDPRGLLYLSFLSLSIVSNIATSCCYLCLARDCVHNRRPVNHIYFLHLYNQRVLPADHSDQAHLLC